MASYELVVRINGADAAFLPIFRNRQQRPKVCTSVSLFVFKDRRRVLHVLLDCGPGVPEAIQAADAFPAPFPIDWFLIGHAHPDHFLGIDALLGDQHWWFRTRGGEAPGLKVLCHPDTFDETLGSFFAFRRPFLDYTPSVPGSPTVLWSEGEARLEVTPVEVVHYRHSVAHLFDFDPGLAGEPTVRVACLFDLAKFHDPGGAEARRGGTADNPFFPEADLIVAESTTWNDPRETVGRPGKHIAFVRLAEYLARWRPRQARIVHYAGFEDAAGTGFEAYRRQVDEGLRIHPSIGPAAEWEVEDAIQRHLATLGYPEPRSVRVGRPMESLVVYPRLDRG